MRPDSYNEPCVALVERTMPVRANPGRQVLQVCVQSNLDEPNPCLPLSVPSRRQPVTHTGGRHLFLAFEHFGIEVCQSLWQACVYCHVLHGDYNLLLVGAEFSPG